MYDAVTKQALVLNGLVDWVRMGRVGLVVALGWAVAVEWEWDCGGLEGVTTWGGAVRYVCLGERSRRTRTDHLNIGTADALLLEMWVHWAWAFGGGNSLMWSYFNVGLPFSLPSSLFLSFSSLSLQFISTSVCSEMNALWTGVFSSTRAEVIHALRSEGLAEICGNNRDLLNSVLPISKEKWNGNEFFRCSSPRSQSNWWKSIKHADADI